MFDSPAGTASLHVMLRAFWGPGFFRVMDSEKYGGWEERES